MACCVPTLKKSKVFTQNQIYILKNSKRYRHKLVLDIDETLLHSTSTAVVGADAVISWVTDMTTKCLYIILRPYAREFILYMSQLYDIYFYSASCMRYVQKLIKIIDPYGTTKGIYSRKHCYQYDSYILKDIRKISSDLSNILLIDNTMSAMYLHPLNGILISSFINDKSDIELITLSKKLDTLHLAKDVIKSIENDTKYNTKVHINKRKMVALQETVKDTMDNVEIYLKDIDMDKYYAHFKECTTLLSKMSQSSK